MFANHLHDLEALIVLDSLADARRISPLLADSGFYTTACRTFAEARERVKTSNRWKLIVIGTESGAHVAQEIIQLRELCMRSQTPPSFICRFYTLQRRA